MVDETGTIWATGRRKSSVARVRLRRGPGAVKINARELENYFPVERHRAAVLAPIKCTKMLGKFDVIANVSGGGFSGQAGAVTLGIARALLKIDESFVVVLREAGYLTRDPRMKERKKYGLHKARRATQFSKR